MIRLAEDGIDQFTSKVYIYKTGQYITLPPHIIGSLRLEHGDEVEITIRKLEG